MTDPIKPQTAYDHDKLVAMSTQMVMTSQAKDDAERAARQAAHAEDSLRAEREKANMARADLIRAEAEAKRKLQVAKRVQVNSENGLFTKRALDRAVQETGKTAVEAAVNAVVAHFKAAGLNIEAPWDVVRAAVQKTTFKMQFHPEEYITRKDLAQQLAPIVMQPIINVPPANPTPITVESAKVTVENNVQAAAAPPPIVIPAPNVSVENKPEITVQPTPVTVEAEVKIPATREEMYVKRDDQGRLAGSVKTVTPLEGSEEETT